MAKLTKSQISILNRANSRLANLLRLSGSTNPELYYTPAVQDALTATNGEIRFHKNTLAAAKSFLRKKTSTVRGAKHYAAQVMGIRQPPSKTAENRRIINTANKRLQAMRNDGRLIPKRFRDITRFSTKTIEQAKQFVQFQNTLKRANRRRYWSLSAAQGEKIHSIFVGFQYETMVEMYYNAVDNGEIDRESTPFKEFARRTQPTMPDVSGAELAEYIRRNELSTYTQLSQERAPKGESVLDVMKGMNFKYGAF